MTSWAEVISSCLNPSPWILRQAQRAGGALGLIFGMGFEVAYGVRRMRTQDNGEA